MQPAPPLRAAPPPPASKICARSDVLNTVSFYDNTSQLTGVDGSGGTCGATGCDESFSFDVNGNRTMTGYTTGSGNRLTSDGTYNYTYDDNGNMLTKTRISDSQKTEFSWDYRNRLTQILVKDSGGNVLKQLDYTYDAFNRRIIQTVDPDGPGQQAATTTKTIYDRPGFTANPYLDFDGSNNLSMRYLFGPAVDFLLARRSSGGAVAWYLADHLGTIRDISNTSGTVIDHVSYSAFGKVTSDSSPTNADRFKYTGREYESETALQYYRARHYDAAIGRFVSEDPVGGDLNQARYVRNRPTSLVDPTGLIAANQVSQPVQPRVDPTAYPGTWFVFAFGPDKPGDMPTAKGNQAQMQQKGYPSFKFDEVKGSGMGFAAGYAKAQIAMRELIMQPLMNQGIIPGLYLPDTLTSGNGPTFVLVITTHGNGENLVVHYKPNGNSVKATVDKDCKPNPQLQGIIDAINLGPIKPSVIVLVACYSGGWEPWEEYAPPPITALASSNAGTGVPTMGPQGTVSFGQGNWGPTSTNPGPWIIVHPDGSFEVNVAPDVWHVQ